MLLAPEIAPGAEGVKRGNVAIVAVGRRQVAEHVGRHPAAVQSLPGEEIVREEVFLVPSEFDREKPLQTSPTQQLRDAARKAEDIREPGYRRPLAEPRLEGALTVE